MKNTLPRQESRGDMSHTTERLPLPSGICLHSIGPKLAEGPAPTFFYFALSAQESLTRDPYSLPALQLAKEGVRVFSVTLPHHGEGKGEKESVESWAIAFGRGEDPLTPWIEQVAASFAYLKQEGLIFSEHLACGGLSRGGFIATRLAAKSQEVRAVLGLHL